MTTTVSQKAKIISEFNTALCNSQIVQAAKIYKEWAFMYQKEFNYALDMLDMKRLVFDAMYDLPGHGDYVDQP